MRKMQEDPTDRATKPGPSSALAPHPVLTEHYSSPAERVQRLSGMFDASARHYDWINQVLSLGSGVRYRRDALRRAGLAPGMDVLDVACGTGVITQLASRIVGDKGSVVAVDPSAGMRAVAKRERSIEALDGTAEHLPQRDASVEFLTMGYALRHVADLRVAFREFARVLRPGGRVLLLEITAPRGRVLRGLLRFYFRDLVPFVMRVGSRDRQAQELMVYHWDSIQNCVRPEVILAALADRGFVDCARHVELGIFSEYTAVRA